MNTHKNPTRGARLVFPYVSTTLAAGVLSAICVTSNAQTTAPSASSQATTNDSTVMRRIRVEADSETTYVPDVSAAGAKGELPLRDVPQSVTVFNETLIRDLAPASIDELADHVAGVDRMGAQANPYAMGFFIRGFTAGNAGTYNGFREYGFNTPQDAINIERIEFLKGPASVLSGGNGALSGLVNLVSKQPLAQSAHRVEATAGSFDHLRASLDSTGPLTSDGTLRYRLTTSFDKDGNFVEGVEQQSLFISPYLSWDIGSDTRLDVELLNQDIDRPGREPYFERHPDFFRIPVETQLGDPGTPAGAGGELTRRLARIDFTHRFGNGLQFRQGLFAHNVDSDDTTIQVFGYDAATRQSTRGIRAVDEYQRERTSQTELSGELATGPVGHQWLTGIEVGRQTSGYAFLRAPYSPVDIFNPQYPGQQLGPLAVPFAPLDSEFETTAIYLQDLVTLGAGFKLMAGLRHDRLEVTDQDRVPGSIARNYTEQELSPRVGVLYQPNDVLTWYASWGRSFTPNSGRDASGERFDPQHGELMELGTKIELAQGLAVNAAVFEYTYQNILTPDPNDTSFSIAVGEQRSRGFEVESIGQITRDWSIVASYSYLDAEITEDNRLPIGDRRQGVPKHSASLFNRLDLTAFGLEQWSVTAGIVYAGKRESGVPNDPAGPLTAEDVRLPSYTRVDAGIIFNGDVFEARVNGRNLTDEKIYDGYNSTIEPRAPRSVEATIALKF